MAQDVTGDWVCKSFARQNGPGVDANSEAMVFMLVLNADGAARGYGETRAAGKVQPLAFEGRWNVEAEAFALTVPGQPALDIALNIKSEDRMEFDIWPKIGAARQIRCTRIT